MTSVKRRSVARWLRWLALIFVIAALPFTWLVVRDVLLIQRATPGEGEDIARGILVDRLVQTIANSSASFEARRPLRLSLMRDPPCFLIDGSTFRPSETPAKSSVNKGKSVLELEEILFLHQSLAERELYQFTQRKIVTDHFSVAELIFFNACISATPVAGWCETKVSDRLDPVFGKAHADMAVSLGIKLARADEPDRYCDTMPGIVGPNPPPAASAATSIPR